MSKKIWKIASLIFMAGLLASVSTARAQRLQFSPTTPTTAYQGGATVAPGPVTTTPVAPQSNFDPYATGAEDGAVLGAPTDPFATQVAPGAVPQTLTPSAGGIFPSSQPPVLFPEGIANPFSGLGCDTCAPQPVRLVQSVSLQHTYLYGGDDKPVLVASDTQTAPPTLVPEDFGEVFEINDSQVVVTTVLPTFLYSESPLLVGYGFAFHSWSGLQPIIPSRGYSAFMDFAWNPQSRFSPQLSYELGFRMGIFSDFEFVNRNSFRHQASALAVLRVTPNTCVKVGVVYLDRVDLKLLPAGGIVWQPNNRTRFDILFPNPKLSQYFATLGNTTVWWYLKGEYGGDSWTVRTPTTVGMVAPGINDGEPDGYRKTRFDINDIRIGGGFEWTYPSGSRGFFEAAYVFNREVVIAGGGDPTIHQDPTVMLRAGLSF